MSKLCRNLDVKRRAWAIFGAQRKDLGDFNQEDVMISFARQKLPYSCPGAVAQASGVEGGRSKGENSLF